jgi:hypothetical protein
MSSVPTLPWAVPVLATLVAAAAPASAGSSVPAACHSALHHGVLPTWARTGFSDPRPRLPHVLGRSGEIAALIFGYPLRSPQLEERGNKILWVSRRAVKPLSDLRIRAQRMEGRRRVGYPVTRVVVGGPGPSGIDLRAPGCWRLTCAGRGVATSSTCATSGARRGRPRDELLELVAQPGRQAGGEGELEQHRVVAQLARAHPSARDQRVAQRGDLVGDGDVDRG